MKNCKTCELDKPLDEFPKDGGNRYKSHCKICYNIKQESYRLKNQESIRSSWRRASKTYHTTERRRRKTLKQYNMIQEDWDLMFESQRGLCKICRIRGAEVVDHDHDTLKVRGLLCTLCNTGLGKLGDNLENILKVVDYLNGTLPNDMRAGFNSEERQCDSIGPEGFRCEAQWEVNMHNHKHNSRFATEPWISYDVTKQLGVL